MNAEQRSALREPFDPSEVGKLPRVTCGDCRNSSTKVCQKHSKSKCSLCSNFITNAHLHLDYVGHAELTDRLLEVDPEWTWEPTGWGDDGAPATARHGSNLVMWGRLTLCGVTRLGVGTAPANKDDAHKELIGDFLRNAAMRFGVALDLWRKSERAEQHDSTDDPDPTEPPAPAPASNERRLLVEQCVARGLATNGSIDELKARLAPEGDTDSVPVEPEREADLVSRTERLRQKAAGEAPTDVKARAAGEKVEA